MRILLFGFLILSLSCGNPVERTIRNSKPPDVSSVINEPVANEQQLLHSFILSRDRVTIKVNGRDTSLLYDDLENYIRLHKKELAGQQLHLVVKKEAIYQQIAGVLDQIAVHKIKEY